MAIGGAFLGGGAEIVPAGYCKLELEILTEDRKNLTATFTIKGTSTYTVKAGADGRAVYTVPAGQTYTVSVNTTGYDNIASQTVVAESGTVRYVRFEAFEGRVKRSGDTMTGNLTIQRASAQYITKDTTYAVTDDLSSNYTYGWLSMKDKNGTDIGRLVTRGYTDGERRVYLEVLNKDRTTTAVISLNTPADKKHYATAPSWSVGTNDNSDKILTIKMANSLPSLVHTTGNETIDGRKTFNTPLSISNAGNFNWSNPSNIRGEKGGSEQNLNFTDANGTPTARIHHYVNSNNLRSILYLETYNKKSDGSTVSASIIAVANTDGTSYALAPTTPTDATSNVIATADWSIGKFVQKSGDEMTGNLSIKATQPTLHLSLDDVGTYGDVDFIKDGQRIGLLRGQIADGENRMVIAVGRPGTNDIDYLLTAINKGDFKPYVTTITPSDKADNSTKIATTSWVNSADSVVHKTGNETISGTKTFSNAPLVKGGRIRCVNPNLPSQSAPTSYQYEQGIIFQDVAYKEVGAVFHQVAKNSTTGETHITSISNGVNRKEVRLSVYSPDDGTGFATAPTTPTDATSNEIATANWVNSKLAEGVQKLALNGTPLSNGNITTSDIQPNDTVTIAITATSIGATAPITFVMDIPSTVETATSVRSSSHVVKSDGKVYSISLFGMYQQNKWEFTIPKLAIADGAISSLAITSFYGHILRAG